MGMMVSMCLNLGSSVYIFSTLRKTRKSMSDLTYRMHLQLTALLCLQVRVFQDNFQGLYPFLCVMFPVCILIVSIVVGGFENIYSNVRGVIYLTKIMSRKGIDAFRHWSTSDFSCSSYIPL